MDVPPELVAVAERVDDVRAPVVTLREMLRWFGLPALTVARRWSIQQLMDGLGLLTIPPLEEAKLDTTLQFRRNGAPRRAPPASRPGAARGGGILRAEQGDHETGRVERGGPAVSSRGARGGPGLSPGASPGGVPGTELSFPGAPERPTAKPASSEKEHVLSVAEPTLPTYRPPPVLLQEPTPQASSRGQEPALLLKHLPEIHRPFHSINPNESLSKACSTMYMHKTDFLVVSRDPRRPQGIIGWREIGHATISRPGSNDEVASHCTKVPVESETLGFLDALRLCEQHQCEALLVHGQDRRIVALLTREDLLRALKRCTFQFLLLDEIEQRMKQFLTAKLPEQMKEASGKNSIGLTFGDYLRIMGEEANWNRLELSLERKIVIKFIDDVREIRNKCAHPSPEGIQASEVRQLSNCLDFLRKIA